MMTPTLRIAENKGRKRSVNTMHKKKYKGLTKTNCPSPITWKTQIPKYSLCSSFKIISYNDEEVDGTGVRQRDLLC